MAIYDKIVVWQFLKSDRKKGMIVGMMEREELWMIFKVAENMYAINSSNILSIGALPDKITHVPEASTYVRGIIRSRGRIVTLLDVRELFGIKAMEAEHREFCRLIDTWKSRYSGWLERMEEEVQSKHESPSADDLQQGDLRDWYKGYETNLVGVGTLLAKTEEPHRKIRELLIDIEKQKGEDEEEVKIQMLQEIKLIHMPQILSLLDQSKAAFGEHYRSMVITLESNGGRAVGIIVDEITGVEHLGEIYQDSTLDKMKRSHLLCGVASREHGDSLMLLLDEARVLDLGREVEVPAGV